MKHIQRAQGRHREALIEDELVGLRTAGGCRCDGGQPKNFLRPCVLLLLKESPAHGYDLLERIRAFGLNSDAGGMYRLLRALEREGCLRSWWESGVNGHDRRTYALTPFGEESLRAWDAALDESRRALALFARRLSRAQSGTRLLESVG